MATKAKNRSPKKRPATEQAIEKPAAPAVVDDTAAEETTAEETTEQKPAGRPPGSNNKEYAVAYQLPAACPKCGSTNLTNVKGAKALTKKIAGVIHGVRYGSVRWQRKVCECKQHVAVREFLPPKK